MKRYEVIAIVKSDLSDEDIIAIMERSTGIIAQTQGVVAKAEKWGKRRLAYEINKQRDGFYFFIDFAGTGAAVAEVERNFKIDDRILKFMTVKKDGAVTREGIDAEFAAAEAKLTQGRQDSEGGTGEREERTGGEHKTHRITPRKPAAQEAPTPKEVPATQEVTTTQEAPTTKGE